MDIWALGVIAYEIITGATPWDQLDEEEAIMAIVYESIDLTVLKDKISEPFLNVIFNCLNKLKEDRWNTLKV